MDQSKANKKEARYWTKEEDEILESTYNNYHDWTKIASELLNRSEPSCRGRYHYTHSESISAPSSTSFYWKPNEDKILLDAVNQYNGGKIDWNKVSNKLPARGPIGCSTRFRLLSKESESLFGEVEELSDDAYNQDSDTQDNNSDQDSEFDEIGQDLQEIEMCDQNSTIGTTRTVTSRSSRYLNYQNQNQTSIAKKTKQNRKLWSINEDIKLVKLVNKRKYIGTRLKRYHGCCHSRYFKHLLPYLPKYYINKDIQ